MLRTRILPCLTGEAKEMSQRLRCVILSHNRSCHRKMLPPPLESTEFVTLARRAQNDGTRCGWEGEHEIVRSSGRQALQFRGEILPQNSKG